MTRYVVDEQNAALMRTWSTGRGDWAAMVSPLPAAAGTQRHQLLAAELTGLSHELWRCYTHPPHADPDTEVNTEDWRRQQNRETFSTVIASVISPNLPDENGNLIVEYDPVGEGAHRVGRALQEIGDRAVLDAVRVDIEAELQAVEDAERGELVGRAGQATVLSRSDASAAQVAAADAILRENPLDAWTALRELEPTAAAIAAAQWLKAAVEAVAGFARLPARRVLAIADDEDGTEHRAAAGILSLLDHLGAYDIVTYEVARALQIAEGYVLDLDEEDNDEGVVELTVLNPQRPAPDLLEELLDSIRSCGQLYTRYSEEKSTAEREPQDSATSDALFCDAVRAKADTHRITIA
ncbi:hypothetical protein [Krasilnikovia sp. MM14-A1004]|uniref:hypothetical protein n=1 Tax=Krasilnikovia sp. MM14-A1004 TaxID=3373541 RepID=UPI00399C9A86